MISCIMDARCLEEKILRGVIFLPFRMINQIIRVQILCVGQRERYASCLRVFPVPAGESIAFADLRNRDHIFRKRFIPRGFWNLTTLPPSVKSMAHMAGRLS